MTSIPKTSPKFGPPRNQLNYISFERYWREVSKNVVFLECEPLCQKLWAFLSKVGLFNDACSPNMVMLFDPRSNFEKFSFRPSSAFNIRKGHKISSRKALNFNRYQPKTSLEEGGGGGRKSPPLSLPLGLTVGMRNHCIGNDSQLQMFTLYRMGFRSSLEIYPMQCEQCSQKSKLTIPDRSISAVFF